MAQNARFLVGKVEILPQFIPIFERIMFLYMKEISSWEVFDFEIYGARESWEDTCSLEWNLADLYSYSPLLASLRVSKL